MLRNTMLIALFALVAGGAAASDKPAAQARERMEAEAGSGEHTVTVRESSTAVRERREEHPVSDVGYHRSQPIVRENREWSTSSSPSNSATKPAVRERQRMEGRGE